MTALPRTADTSVLAQCHCGRIRIRLSCPPDEVVACNCSLCRSYGLVWAYFDTGDIMVSSGKTDTYAWNGRHVDFHRCATCGCITHWTPRDQKRDQRGVNANLLPLDIFHAARLRHRDGAGSGKYLD